MVGEAGGEAEVEVVGVEGGGAFEDFLACGGNGAVAFDGAFDAVGGVAEAAVDAEVPVEALVVEAAGLEADALEELEVPLAEREAAAGDLDVADVDEAVCGAIEQLLELVDVAVAEVV